MAYDRADWHHGGDFPEDLAPENGATHIGVFLGWAIKRGLVGAEHLADNREAIAAVCSGQISGRDFLMHHCDGKFLDADLNDEGKRFADAYYDEHYVNDYSECLDSDLPSLYHVEDSAPNRAKMEAVLDRRFAAWRGSADPVRPLGGEPKAPRRPKPEKKPWWRFW